MKEIWDDYDANGNLLGFDTVRGEKLPHGVFHLVAEALVKHLDGSFLLMLRSSEKEKFPLFYEASAGGSALKGEDRLACVKRELKEECGIEALSFEEVAFNVFPNDRCLFYSFLALTDCDKNSVTTQEGETVGYKWITEKEFIDFVNGDGMIPRQRNRFAPYFKKCGYLK